MEAPTHHRIIQLQASNVKRLKAVTISPKGNLVVIGGRNGQGKTSVLDSISMAIGGGREIPAKPIRQGADKGRIVLDLGEFVVKRTFTEGGGSVVIEDAAGKKLSSPQEILNKLTGKLTFDPLEFCRMDREKQAAALKKLVGLDFSDIDARRQKLYDERTDVNREVERLRALVTNKPAHPGTPEPEVSTAEIVAEMEAAQKQNEQYDRVAADVRVVESNLANSRTVRDALARDIEQLEKRLAELKEQFKTRCENVAALEEQHATARRTLDAQPRVDLAPFRQKLAEAEVVNKRVRENAERAKLIADGKAARQKADDLTAKIEAADAEKRQMLENAKYPIEGLSFDEQGVTFNKIPFAQASAAEQMRVSVAIGAAMNPTLRVMCIRDGSLLDDDSMTLLAELAEKHDLQVWIERVGKDARSSVIIEDGQVEGADEAQTSAE